MSQSAAKYYEYVLIFTPRAENKDARAPKPKLISDGVQGCLASSEQEAQMIAARAIPEEYADKLDQVQVGLRPF